MSLSEVNAKYQQLFDTPMPEFHYSLHPTHLIFASAIFLVLVCIKEYEMFEVWKDIPKGESIVFTVMSSACGICVIWLVLSIFTSLSDTQTRQQAYVEHLQQQIDQWRTEVAEPYLASLPVQKSPLLYLAVDMKNAMPDETDQQDHKTPFIISYQDGNQVQTITERLPTQIAEAGETSPFLSYVVLDQPLGVINRETKRASLCLAEPCMKHLDAEYSAGSYNYRVYLPKGYSLKARP